MRLLTLTATLLAFVVLSRPNTNLAAPATEMTYTLKNGLHVTIRLL